MAATIPTMTTRNIRGLIRSSPRKRGPRILDSRLRGNERPEALDASALYRLMAWLSPAFPTGAFSCSSGLEWAVQAGDVTDENSLGGWLEVMLREGSGFCDAVFFTHAYRAAAQRDVARLRGVADLALAFAPSKEKYLETTAQGRAFFDTVRAAWPAEMLDNVDDEIALPVAVAVACAGHGVPEKPALASLLQAYTANLISAGVRLIPLGQTQGQRLLAQLEPVLLATAERAGAAPLDDIGSITLRADLASMHHETQYTRLFRS
jgi:urease accessory protein